jgi:hypothetical protein
VSEQPSDPPPPPADDAGAGLPADGAAAGPPKGAVQVRLRRAPRYRPFVATGAVLGALVGLVAGGTAGNIPAGFSSQTVLGYFGAIGVLFGVVVGAGAAVLVERRRG